MGFLKKFTTALAGLGALVGVQAASLQQVTNYGANSSGTKMFIYVPDNVSSNPAIIVAIHYCTGTANAYYTGTPYARLAEQHGFVVIYPESPYSGGCWDVSSTAALTHNGGADSNSIANMVTYTLNQYNGDASRVYVTGSSSGAMMTNVMAATYPEMFAAAIAYSGVPAGCFYTGTVQGWNSTCSQGNSIHTQQEWADTVFRMYPGYSGPRPRMQIYHGSDDTILYPQNYDETIKQWTGVFGYSATPQRTLQGTPSGQYTTYVFGDKVVGIYGQGVGHTVPVMGDEDMKFFGFVPGSLVPTGPGNPPTTTTTPPPGTTTTTTTTQPPPTTTSGGQQQSKWGQCGGIGWSGPTQCVAGTTCQYSNDWYSQCL